MPIFKYPFPPDIKAYYTQELANQLAYTHAAISSLNQMSRLLQNANLLMRPILAKEAESSAQLEGTQASIEDAYQIDITDQSEEKRNEAIEIRNYEQAMLAGLEIIKKTGLTELLIRETHKRLLQGVRGQKKHPGLYRKGDVWIGPLGTTKKQARYLPPNAIHVPKLMEELLEFSNNIGAIHPLIACGMIHHRFEAIHPFEDGNGRIGRLLISLYLVKENILTFPILYPSGFFEKNRKEYTYSLSKVDNNEKWYDWLMFFLKGMEIQAKLSSQVAINIDNLFRSSRNNIEEERAGLNLIRVLEHTFSRPYITSAIISDHLKIPRSSCDRYLQTLSSKRILKDIGIFRRQRVFVNVKLITILRRI